MKAKKNLVTSIIENADITSPHAFAQVMHRLNDIMLAAAAKGRISVIKEFHEAAWDMERQINGTTALIEAIKHNKRGRNDVVIAFILDKYGSYAASATDDHNKPPLFHAIKADGGIQQKTIAALASHNIDVNTREKFGRTVFEAHKLTTRSANFIRKAWSKTRGANNPAYKPG
ncbi:MAG: hypothetical protein A2018_02195 [Alphaproteobacteria bacterium GWF2_58_20]|nr:MAG: hypothetical protein A2018_02195 [Alphaproteobacteria bacterium GWF2_58_20]